MIGYILLYLLIGLTVSIYNAKTVYGFESIDAIGALVFWPIWLFIEFLGWLGGIIVAIGENLK